jgi:hypothetical protein
MDKSLYRIEVTKIEHFEKIMPRDYDAQNLFSSYKDTNAFLEIYIKQYAFTAFYGDDIITIAGLYPLEPGKAEAWMFTGQELPKHARFIMTQLKNHLNMLENSLKLRRIQAVCVGNFEEAHKFIQHFGFKCETPDGMQQYGPNGEMYKLYARTKNHDKT